MKLPPSMIIKKGKSIILKSFKTKQKRKTAFTGTTYVSYPSLEMHLSNLHSNNGIPGYFEPPSTDVLKGYKEQVFSVADRIVAHEFNVLGSGWTYVGHNSDCPGFEGYRYSPADRAVEEENLSFNSFNDEPSSRILEALGNSYNRIDWQLDFRSGYQWNEYQWYKDIEYGNVPGADIKIPWELGRMQHLIVLAYAFILSGGSGKGKSKNVYAHEFENQVIDFIGSNPPEFGVQWICAMDVAIRAINWLICYDYFTQAGYSFPDEFKRIFWESIYQHGCFIASNLEWADGMRANHYLANITGLMFIASYLAVDEEISTWLAFSIQEFIVECSYQFDDDGSNFEASTCYHLLSSELLLLSFMLCLALKSEKVESLKTYISGLWTHTPKLGLPASRKYRITQNNAIIYGDDIINRLNRIFTFGYDLVMENGNVVQVGDNDSGRIVKLSPYDIENNRDKTYYRRLLNGLKDGCKPDSVEEFFTNRFFDLFKDRYDFSFTWEPVDRNELKSVLFIPYKDFGLYHYITRYYSALVRCGKVGQKGKGGHTHNDQLSMALSVNGKDFIVDPGTFNYTALPEQRNKFRSTRYHSTLEIVGSEQNDIPQDPKDGLFWLPGDRSKANALKASASGFIGEHFGFRASHRRTLNFDVDKIAGFDYCNIGLEKNVYFYLAPEVEIDDNEKKSIFQRITLKNGSALIEISTSTDIFELKPYYYSPEYGVKTEANVLVMVMKGISSSWNIEIISV